MSKYINEFPQHFDSNGDPNAFYTVYFGLANQDPKANPKAPFSDAALSNAISPIQVLNATGAYGSDIFLDGEYSIRIEDTLGALWRESPSIFGIAGGTVPQGDDWDIVRTYALDDIVQGSDGKYYISITGANTGNDPISSLASWSKKANPTIYNVNETYDIDDACLGSDGISYLSIVNANIGNDPVTDLGVNWTAGLSKVQADILDLISASDRKNWPTVATNLADPLNDIDFIAGKASDSTGVIILDLASTLTKKIDAAWVEGDAAGGLFTGSVAIDTTYALFIIHNPTTDTTDAGFDLSPTAPTLPTGYTTFQRIALLYTDSSANFIQFKQRGDYFFPKTITQHYSDPAPGTSAVTIVADVPTGVEIIAMVTHSIRFSSATDVNLLITSLDQTDSAPSIGLAHLQTGATSFNAASQFLVKTDTSASYRSRIGVSPIDRNFALTNGWIDDRSQ